MRKGLVIAGSATLGAMYLLTFFVGLVAVAIDEGVSGDDNSEFASLFIPVAGPFVGIATIRPSSSGMALLALDGAAQAGGLAMLIGGLAARETILVRNRAIEVRVAPVMGSTQQGIGLVGRF
jgi:hypothetical protein